MTVDSPVETLLQVDPGTLVIGMNVRLNAKADDKKFLASIKARGVLEPISAWRDDAGQIVVDRGQRRTLAAVEAGLESVPVRLIDKPDEADRIVDQLTENLHRAEMESGEVVAAVEQLSLIGVSAAQIVKRTALDRKSVQATLKVVSSKAARDALTEGRASLDKALVLAEFDGDEAALERLVPLLDHRSPWVFNNAASALRREREEAAMILAEIERLRESGVPVLDADQVPEDLHAVLARHMRDGEGQPIPEAEWPQLAGAIQVVTVETGWVIVTAEDGTEHEDHQQHAVASWIVPDTEAAGLVHYSDQVTGMDGAPLSDEQIEDRKAAEKAERVKVRTFNAAWRAAEPVRRAWLSDFLRRKSAPTGAEALICEAILTESYDLGKAIDTRHKMLMELLGEPVQAYYGNPKACRKFATSATTPKALTMRSLAAIIAAWEARLGVHTWRNPGEWDKRVLTELIGWGYPASPIERILIGEKPTVESVAA